MAEVQERVPMRILAWCLMPNHWHLLLWPEKDGQLSTFMRLLTLTHTQRVHAYRASSGTGHLYQGRFKSFAVQDDRHFLAVARYVEANALSAGLVARAEAWRWGSLWRTLRGEPDSPPRLHGGPLDRPSDWVKYVNERAPNHESEALRRCARRGCPYGDEAWTVGTAEQLGLQSTLRPRGRPPSDKGPDQESGTFSGKRVLTPF